jgi:hypothetical protein
MRRFIWLLLAAPLLVCVPRADAQLKTLWDARTTAGTSVTVAVSDAKAVIVQLKVGSCSGDYDLIVEGQVGDWQTLTLDQDDGHITKGDVGADETVSWEIPAGFQRLRSTILPGIADCAVSLFVSQVR